LVPGDVILYLDGQSINSPRDYQSIIYSFPPGETLRIKRRDGAHGGQVFTAWVVLDE
jgi:S1-C subfamily serine protease